MTPRWAIAIALLAACGGSKTSDSPPPAGDEPARRLAAQQDAVVLEPERHWYTVPDATPNAFGATGLPECDRYMTAVTQLSTCANMPQSSRDMWIQAAKQIHDTWNAGNSPDVQQVTNDACKQAVEAIRQVAQSMGCTLNLPP